MIHHFSMPAADTANVAKVLAEIFDGTIVDFKPTANAYMVWFGDDYGSAIEVYPSDIQLTPGDKGEPCQFKKAEPSTYGAVHVALSIEKNRQEILAIGKRENWRVEEFVRGSFAVLEFWVENCVMLELLTADMAADYLILAEKYRKDGRVQG